MNTTIINTGDVMNYHVGMYSTQGVSDDGALKNNTLTVAIAVIFKKTKLIYIVMFMTLLVVIRVVAFGK